MSDTISPVPWKFDEKTEIYAADGLTVCQFYGPARCVNKKNASLIAAAPELLEALEDVIQLLDMLLIVKYEGEESSPRQKALKAIAKAKGEAEQ